MPTLLARGCSSVLAARVKAYAADHGLSVSEAVQALLTYALDQRDARAKGGRRAAASQSPAERSAAARRAVTARWAAQD